MFRYPIRFGQVTSADVALERGRARCHGGVENDPDSPDGLDSPRWMHLVAGGSITARLPTDGRVVVGAAFGAAGGVLVCSCRLKCLGRRVTHVRGLIHGLIVTGGPARPATSCSSFVVFTTAWISLDWVPRIG